MSGLGARLTVDPQGAIGEIYGGVPSKLTLELATLARQLAEKSGGESRTVLIGKAASSE